MHTKIVVGLLLIITSVAAQAQTVAGKLVSEEGQPIPGANILLSRTGLRVLAGDNGQFYLAPVKKGDTLQVTAAGYDALNWVVDSSVVTLVLRRSTKELEEVTIQTGYESLPRERVTGSYSRVNAALLNEQVSTGLLTRLPFIANGLSANTAAITAPGRVSPSNGLVLRGISTLSSAISNPLIILDNFPYEGDLMNINPNDVESVTFLKDAAAASIWGARAGNGVIVITTKKSRFEQPLRVQFNANTSLTPPADLFSLPQVGSPEIITLEEFLFEKGFQLADTLSINRYPFSEVYQVLLQERRGLITPQQKQERLAQLRNQDVRNDYLQHFYQTAVNQQYALSLSGGSQRHAWLLSLGYDHNSSETAEAYKRTTLRWNNTYKLTSRLQVSAAIDYTDGRTYNGKPSFGTIGFARQVLPPYTRFTGEDGRPLPLYNQYAKDYLDTAGGGLLLDWKYTPLTDYQHTKQRNLVKATNAVLGLAYNFSGMFSLDIKYRYQEQTVQNQTTQALDAYYTRDYINSFSQIDRATGKVNYIVPKGAIRDLAERSVLAQDLRAQLRMAAVRNKNSVNMIAGVQVGESVSQGSSYRVYGLNTEYLTYSNVDYVNRYPNLVTGSMDAIANNLSLSRTNNRTVSLYSNASYSYDNRYAFSVSARRDASNLFGVSTNNQWKPMWSTGLSWNISKERFYSLSWLDELKFRMTYGTQGNSDPSRVAVTTFRYASSPNPFTQAPYSELENVYNPSLRWENVAMLNMGIDFATKNNRIKGSIEHYRKYIDDLYDNVPVDPTTGLQRSFMVQNVATMRGQGWDIEINTRNIDRAIKWNTQLIVNTYRDRITDRKVTLQASSVVSGAGIPGYSVYAYFAYPWAGLDPQTGDPRGYLNKEVSGNYAEMMSANYPLEDLVHIGSLSPRWFGSLGNNLQWKGLALAIRATFKLDYFIKRPSISYNTLISTKSGHSDYNLRWQQPGDEQHTDVPSFIYPAISNRDNFYLNSEVLATRGDHIRLQYVNLSYSLPLKAGAVIRDCQFFITVNNLGLIWKANRLDLDPDYYRTTRPRKTFATGIRLQL